MLFPEISDGCLLELAGRIHPLVRDGDGNLRAIQPVKLCAAGFGGAVRMMERVGDVRRVAVVRTVHAAKPSVAEVLAQIPFGHLMTVKYFEAVVEADATHSTMCVARTALYVPLIDDSVSS